MKNTTSLQLQLYGLLNSTANDREITCDKSRLNPSALSFTPMSDCHYSFNLAADASFTDLSPIWPFPFSCGPVDVCQISGSDMQLCANDGESGGNDEKWCPGAAITPLGKNSN